MVQPKILAGVTFAYTSLEGKNAAKRKREEKNVLRGLSSPFKGDKTTTPYFLDLKLKFKVCVLILNCQIVSLPHLFKTRYFNQVSKCLSFETKIHPSLGAEITKLLVAAKPLLPCLENGGKKRIILYALSISFFLSS